MKRRRGGIGGFKQETGLRITLISKKTVLSYYLLTWRQNIWSKQILQIFVTEVLSLMTRLTYLFILTFKFVIYCVWCNSLVKLHFAIESSKLSAFLVSTRTITHAHNLSDAMVMRHIIRTPKQTSEQAIPQFYQNIQTAPFLTIFSYEQYNNLNRDTWHQN